MGAGQRSFRWKRTFLWTEKNVQYKVNISIEYLSALHATSPSMKADFTEKVKRDQFSLQPKLSLRDEPSS